VSIDGLMFCGGIVRFCAIAPGLLWKLIADWLYMGWLNMGIGGLCIGCVAGGAEYRPLLAGC